MPGHHARARPRHHHRAETRARHHPVSRERRLPDVITGAERDADAQRRFAIVFLMCVVMGAITWIAIGLGISALFG